MSQRTEQVSALIQERIGEFFSKHLELKDALVTVTRVETAPDLKHANVFISVLPESRRGSGLAAVTKLRGEVGRSLFRDLSMRPVPAIHFQIDELEAHAATIEDLLNQIHEE